MTAHYLSAMLPESSSSPSNNQATSAKKPIQKPTDLATPRQSQPSVPHDNHQKPSASGQRSSNAADPILALRAEALRLTKEHPTDSIPADPMLTTALAARLLGRKPSALKKWRQRKMGPAYIRHHDGIIVYRLSAIGKYIEEHTVTP